MSPHRGKRPSPRKVGRHINDRLRAMRFALWAQRIDPSLLTVKQIGGLLDLHKSGAAKWRRDYLLAISPTEIDGVPSFLTPAPAPASTNRSPPTATGVGQPEETK